MNARYRVVRMGHLHEWKVYDSVCYTFMAGHFYMIEDAQAMADHWNA